MQAPSQFRGLSHHLRHPHVKNFLLLFSAGGGARVLQVLAYPILLYIYTPSAFGLYAGYTMIVSVASAFATMRYEWAIPVARNPKHAAGILLLSVLAAGALAAIMLVAFGAFPHALLRWTRLPGLEPVAWLAAFSTFGIASCTALTYWAIRLSAFAAIARTQIARVASELSTQFALGLAGFGIWGLAVGHVAGTCAGLLSLTRVGGLRKLVPQSPARLYVLAKSWRDFPLYSGTAGLLSQAATRITLVALGAMFSSAALGLLWAAFAILDAPISVISSSAARIFYQRACEIWRDDPARLRGLYLKTAGTTLALSFAGGALAYFVLPWLIHAALPARWVGASGLVRALIPAYVGQLTVMPFDCYGVVRRQGWQLGWNVFYLVVNFAVLAAAPFIGGGLVALVTVLSLARCAAFLTVIPIHLHILKPRHKTALKDTDTPQIFNF